VAGVLLAGMLVRQWVIHSHRSDGSGRMEEATSAGGERGKAGFIDTRADVGSLVYGMVYGLVVGWMLWAGCLGVTVRPGSGHAGGGRKGGKCSGDRCGCQSDASAEAAQPPEGAQALRWALRHRQAR
jgi:hypothetical protein